MQTTEKLTMTAEESRVEVLQYVKEREAEGFTLLSPPQTAGAGRAVLLHREEKFLLLERVFVDLTNGKKVVAKIPMTGPELEMFRAYLAWD